ncbi:MAG: hypothetical protein LQ338_002035 [Usnochroma carphineum]|nr:MAG: hypothetical protein LQ338_002035 [Usnochroma carphineum]
MLPTPSTSHVNTARVYEPAEDSFLFLDTLSSIAESSFLKAQLGQDSEPARDDRVNPSPLIVEVGIGSGVVLGFVTAHAQAILGRSDIISLGLDINQYACKASTQTVELACRDVAHGSFGGSQSTGTGLFLTSLNADLTSAIRPGTVDVLIFNPPYVPTAEVPQTSNNHGNGGKGEEETKYEENANLISLSYAGGTDGMEVTNRLLEQLPSVLNAQRGVAYILLCKQNRPEEVVQRIRQWGSGWTVNVVGCSGKQSGWEKLQILRICQVRLGGVEN